MSTGLEFRRASTVVATAALAATLLWIPAQAATADATAAQALARQNNCFKCHSVDQKRVGPAWKDVAAKYKSDKDAEAKMIKHLTTGPKAKFADGHEEDHPIIKSKSPEETKNLADWILSL